MLSVTIGAISFFTGIAFSKALDRQMLSASLTALILLPILALTRLRQSSLQGLHKIIPGQLPELLLQPALFILLLMASYVSLRRGLSVEAVLLLHITAAACAFIVGAWLLYRNLPQEVRRATPTYQKQAWIGSAAPLFLITAMQTINSHADVIFLGAIKGAEAVGIYSAANRLAALISLILIAVNTPLAPTVARLYAEGNMERLQEVITKSVRLITLVALPVAASMLLFGDRFLQIFGMEFTRGRAALSILCIGQIFNASMGSGGLLLTMTGHERYAAIGVGSSAVLNIILNACFIPLWGIEGAAFSTSACMIIWNIILAFVVRKKLGINSTILQSGRTS
jgi:O-antigen/teichoic acid export membrane protein